MNETELLQALDKLNELIEKSPRLMGKVLINEEELWTIFSKLHFEAKVETEVKKRLSNSPWSPPKS